MWDPLKWKGIPSMRIWASELWGSWERTRKKQRENAVFRLWLLSFSHLFLTFFFRGRQVQLTDAVLEILKVSWPCAKDAIILTDDMQCDAKVGCCSLAEGEGNQHVSMSNPGSTSDRLDLEWQQKRKHCSVDEFCFSLGSHSNCKIYFAEKVL